MQRAGRDDSSTSHSVRQANPLALHRPQQRARRLFPAAALASAGISRKNGIRWQGLALAAYKNKE
jgi:hypothetical protein